MEWLKINELNEDWMAYVDAPWGGIHYNKLTTIDELHLYDEAGNEFGLRDLVKSLNTRFVVLKLPHNYNVGLLEGEVEIFKNTIQPKIIHAIIRKVQN
jgi:hypothetical protein